MPKTGIQSATSTNWKARAGPGRKPTSSSSETTQVSEREAERERPRARTPARTPTTIAPTSGRKMMIDRIGMLVDVHRQRPARIEVRAGHHDQPEGDPERVVLDPAGLDLAQAAAGADA